MARVRAAMMLALVAMACGPSLRAADTDGGASSSGSSSSTTSAGRMLSTVGTASSASGVPPWVSEGECQADYDCELVSDCCACTARVRGGSVPACGQTCDQTVCDAEGIGSARCVVGWCRIAQVTCDPKTVKCPDYPPACDPGMLPEVQNECWTDCVPVEACDKVPDCSYCAQDELCVTYEGLTSGYGCFPFPAGCSDDPEICLCEAICSGPFATCTPNGDGVTCMLQGG